MKETKDTGGKGSRGAKQIKGFTRILLIAVAWTLICVLAFSGRQLYSQMSKRAKLKTSGKGSVGAAMADMALKSLRSSEFVPDIAAQKAEVKAQAVKVSVQLLNDGQISGNLMKNVAIGGDSDDEDDDKSEDDNKLQGGHLSAANQATLQKTSSSSSAPLGNSTKKRTKIKSGMIKAGTGEVIAVIGSTKLPKRKPYPAFNGTTKTEYREWKKNKDIYDQYDPYAYWQAANATGDLQEKSKHFFERPWSDGFALEDSNCSKCFNESLAPKPSQLVLPHVVPLGPPTIQILTLGMGTTATRTLFDNWCNRGWKSLHYAKFCNFPRSDWQRKFIMWFRAAHQPLKWKKINITETIDQTVISGAETIVDAPVPHFSPRFVALLPNAKVIHTLRPPHSWAASRMKNHGWDWICHPKLWDIVAHPFDFEKCMVEPSGIVDVHTHCTVDSLAEAYIRYNTWVAHAVPAEKTFRVCFWDCVPGTDCSPESKAKWFQDRQEAFLAA